MKRDSAAVIDIPSFTDTDAPDLGLKGFTLRNPFLPASFADRLPDNIDEAIKAGTITPPADRIVDGRPTEWIMSVAPVRGNGPGSTAYAALPPWSRSLYEGLQKFAMGYEAVRARMIELGLVTEAEAPAIAVGGMEMNVNKVVEGWSGLRTHRDDARFSAALQGIALETTRHAAVRARVLSMTGYARRPNGMGQRDDRGGDLPFQVRQGARNPGDGAVFDIVRAAHNTGAVFFAHTIHGVARMPLGTERYSFQAFFPARDAWEAIARRIAGQG
jgi:hypothetical protein